VINEAGNSSELGGYTSLSLLSSFILCSWPRGMSRLCEYLLPPPFLPVLLLLAHGETYFLSFPPSSSLQRSCTHHYPFSSNLKHALLLANDVADARYKLYEDFTHEDGSKPRLRDYLGAVRQAVVAGLEGGGGDPWRVVGI
jgi:hypothetical protein